MWRIGWAPNSIPIYSYIQQDATLHSLFVSGNCSTCFGWYFHPSSGAQTTVSTASGISHAVTVICRYRGGAGTLSRWRQITVTVWKIPDAVDTVVCAPEDGWRYHPKHVEQFPELCKVASHWIYIRIIITMHGPMEVTLKEWTFVGLQFNPLNAELNPICHLLALLAAHHIFYVSGLRVKQVICSCRQTQQCI